MTYTRSYLGQPAKGSEVRVLTDPNAKLPYPHYSDPRFKDAVLVWKKEGKPDHYVHSDRLFLDDNFDKAYKEMIAMGIELRTANWDIAFVNIFFKGKKELIEIMVQYKDHSSFPVWIYGLINKE